MVDDMEDGLSPLEFERYRRHLPLPKMGIEGQQRLKAASVLVVGLGGLGSISSLYLALAGVGTLGLVEDDLVSLSNLHRQILYTTNEIGQPKLAIATQKLRQHNPEVQLKPYACRFNEENAVEIVQHFDLVVDGTDNIKTRRVINSTCLALDKPYVYGAVNLYDGQVSVFHGSRGPCLACVFVEAHQELREKQAEQLAVLNTLPAIVATMQTTEVIKLITGVGKPLIGKLLIFNAINVVSEHIAIQKKPHCPVCA
jgi:molybdopterin/thiamine biosynthesis adenylyltransferase